MKHHVVFIIHIDVYHYKNGKHKSELLEIICKTSTNRHLPTTYITMLNSSHTLKYSCIATFIFDVSCHSIVIHTHTFSFIIVVFCVKQKFFLECLVEKEGKQQQRIFKRIPPMSDEFLADGKGRSQRGALLLCEYCTAY